jgi:phosphoenolpyruvate carboxykinase (GTP)
VGDDIAWMHFRDDGRLYAVNPENGFFGVAPGTSEKSNPIAMKMIEKKTIFTNVALTKEGDVWWEGMTDEAPEELIDWKGNYWKKGSKEKSAHPNSRFTVSKHSCPIYDILGDDPQGVPIDAIIFGGRRSTLLPLVLEAYSWPEGVLMGASLSSEMTAAAEGELGALRHDPFAMLPFCGYHMGDYFQHWLDLEKPHRKMPQIFSVNWFRKNEKGEYIWPGFGENARVLKWIFNRIELEDEGRKTALGFVPNQLDLKGLNQNPKEIEKLFEVDPVATNKEIDLLRDYFQITFGDRFPIKLLDVLVSWKNRL